MPSDNHNSSKSLAAHPMLFYRRATTDDHASFTGDATNHSLSPIQVIYANGEISLGIPIARDDTRNITERQDVTRRNIIIASPPDNSSTDIRCRRLLKFCFTFLFILNVVSSFFLYQLADRVDTTLVQSNTNEPPVTLQIVSRFREPNENALFSLTILILCIGEAAVLTENILVIAFFSLAIILNFFFSIPNLPYFIYCVRYFLDIAMLYLGLALKSKLSYNYVSARIVQNRRNN